MTMRKTYTILAVAFTATACGGVGSEAVLTPEAKQSLAQEFASTSLDEAIKNRDHFSPLCDEAGYPLPGNVNPKQAPSKVEQFCNAIAPGTPSTPSASTPRPTQPPQSTQPPPARPTQACDRDALNKELSNVFALQDALTQVNHFRCLCDDQGYPLVGNINSKGIAASTFCSALKQKGLL